MTQHTARARALLLMVLALALAACVRPTPAAQPSTAPVAAPAPPAPRTDLNRGLDGYLHPTLAEYVDTLAVFAAPGDSDAVHVLEADVFGYMGQHTLDCVAAITHRESTDFWTSYNRSGATGLTQLLGHADLALTVTGSGDVFNPWINLVTARALSQYGANWQPWTPAPPPC